MWRSRQAGVLAGLGLLAAIGLPNLGTSASAAAATNDCVLSMPADPLSATGLATPYVLNAACREGNSNQAAFVQGAILDPATGKISLYDPLVINTGTVPAIKPVVPTLPAGAIVGLWFGFQGDNLRLRAPTGTLGRAACVNGISGSIFGQYAYCNARAFFTAARKAISAGQLKVPPLGTGKDGLPCPTVRDFGVADQDQSDNVTTTYLLKGSATAQNTAKNAAALTGARVLSNGSDNGLLDFRIDPALGCTPMKAPNIVDGALQASLPLNELQAGAFQKAPIALVPLNNPMTLDGNGQLSTTKTNAYRVGVGQPTINTATETPKAYCTSLMAEGARRTQLDRRFTSVQPSPATDATNLFTFLGARLSASFDNLDCAKFTGTKNPVTLTTNAAGVVQAVDFGPLAK